MFKLRILNLMILVSYTFQSSVQHLLQPGSFMFWLFAFISLFLSCFAGVCSGLTVGYMAINKKQMQMWAISKNQNQRTMSKPILQVLQNHHMLLSTLLLANALCLQALPIFLDRLVPGYMAIIISTIAVVVFGQVLPQSYCTGHNKVKIGYYFSGFVKALQCLLYIIVRPIVYILDNWIGHHGEKVSLNADNMKAILYLHNSRQYGYRQEEIQILQNTVDLRVKQVVDHMIPIEKTFAVSESAIVNVQLIEKLQKANFSKVAVYNKSKSNITGYVKIKNLLTFNVSSPQPLNHISHNVINPIMKISTKQTLLDLIQQFKKNKKNFAAVINPQNQKCVGIITLKQIFVQLVLKEFNDNDIRVNLKLGKGENDSRLQNLYEGVEQD